MFNNQNQGPVGAKPQAQPKAEEARGPSKFAFLVLVLGGIFLTGVVVGGYDFVDGLAAVNRATEIEAQAGLAREQADMYRGQAEMYKGLSEAYKNEADKWRGYGAAVSAWADPLGVLPKTLGAVALILVAAGAALGIGRVLWGMGRSGEIYVAARVEVAKRQSFLLIEQQRALLPPGQPVLPPESHPVARIAAQTSAPPAEKPKPEHKFDPKAGLPKFLKNRAGQEGTTPTYHPVAENAVPANVEVRGENPTA